MHLTGPNGAGKTTLLRALEAALVWTDEVVAAMPQDLVDPRTELARVRALDPAMRGRVLGVAATLGVDPEQLLVTDAPSPGEARKLTLAELLVSDPGVLILDEPTNDLDLPSIERLQDALVGWPGALVLVAHDAQLAGAATTTAWVVTAGHADVGDGAHRPADPGGSMWRGRCLCEGAPAPTEDEAMQMQVDREIAASPEQVWSPITERDGSPRLLSGVTHVERLGGPAFGVGSRWRETRVMLGREATEAMTLLLVVTVGGIGYAAVGLRTLRLTSDE